MMGGGVSINDRATGTVHRPELRQRNRGGPRPEAERRRRGPSAVYDFAHVRSDVQWIGLTSGVSLVVVLLFWVALRA